MRPSVAFCIFALATFTSLAQTTRKTAQTEAPTLPGQSSRTSEGALTGAVPIQINRMVIVLDPEHGGIDSGSQIGDTTIEKDVTLALAYRLRSLLSVRGFTVVMTRDADIPAVPDATGPALTLDDRAGIANHAQAAACLLLHATGSGNGVHLYASELNAASGQPPVEPPLVPWLTAQAAWVAQSRELENQLAAALTRAGVPLVTSRASVRPLDYLTCPALVVELAPEDSNPDSINHSDYQQRVAQAIAGALLFWPSRVRPPLRLPLAASSLTHNAAKDSAPPAPEIHP